MAPSVSSTRRMSSSPAAPSRSTPICRASASPPLRSTCPPPVTALLHEPGCIPNHTMRPPTLRRPTSAPLELLHDAPARHLASHHAWWLLLAGLADAWLGHRTRQARHPRHV